MGILVCHGALCQCSFGSAPSPLKVLPQNRVTASTPAASIRDHIPVLNVTPFGMCNSISNPVVAQATAKAGGKLTPQPCMPATAAPWVPGSLKVKLGVLPALSQTDKLNCNWGGVISILFAGQIKIQLK